MAEPQIEILEQRSNMAIDVHIQITAKGSVDLVAYVLHFHQRYIGSHDEIEWRTYAGKKQGSKFAAAKLQFSELDKLYDVHKLMTDALNASGTIKAKWRGALDASDPRRRLSTAALSKLLADANQV